MMTKEKDDPEKRNLLLEHKEEKKRRQYSGSRTKTGRSGDSSCSEHRKRGHPYKSSSTEHRAEFKLRQTQSVHNQSEKRDSWWFWQKESPKKNTEDTCSCVSCALPRLKKIVNSEYACIGCLLFLFTVSIIVAFLVVFKNVPCLSGPSEKEVPCKHKIPDSERLKRKIEMLNVNRRRNDFLGLDEYRKNDKRGYDDELTGGIGFSGSSGIDFGPSFRELQSSLEDSDTMISGDAWASVMEADKAISDNQSSEKLREFYKKLVQTDAKIKSLKKINQEYLENVEPVLKVPERSKRSLKLNNRPRKYLLRRRRSAFNKNHKIDITKRQANETKLKLNNLEKKQANKTRMEPNNKTKRQVNTTRVNRNDPDEPTGFVIERKKILVRYKPEPAKKKKVPKCSHAPKDSHTHENQLKHPFYKNTQRLDELLDMFLNKNLPEIVSDPFGLDTLFSKEREKSNKCKHPKPHKNVNIIAKELLADQIPKPKPKVQKVKEEAKDEPMILKVLAPESSTQFEKEFAHHEAQMVGKEKQQIVTASPNDFEVLLSVSTIMNPDLKKTGKLPAVIGRLPNIRKLMQIEGDDEENLGYEDFKEVLKDDVENIDDTEKRTDRRKRTEEQQTAQQQQDKFPKYNPPGVHNPNWKGPMPLYPDELNSMLRHSALNSTKAGKTSTTVSNEVQPGLIERRGRDLSDVEYVEDYLNSKYDKLVEMAQAYSDYGVLDGKKETRHEKASDSTATEHRVKMSASPMKSGLFGRFRKDRPQHIQTGTTANVRKYRAISTSEIEEMTEQTGGIPNTFFYTPPRKTSEGIRFEIVPDMTTRGREDNLEVLKILQKHIRIGPTNTPTRIAPKPISPKTVLIANETANHKKPVKQSNESVNEYVTKKVQAQTENRADGDVNLSDFFNMISEWFKTLENVKEEPANDKPDQEVATTAELLFKVDNSTDEPNTTEITTTTPSTTSFQLYDTDVIENIGHRSRMLLSVENLNATEEIRTGDVNGTREKRAETAGNASEASSLPTPTTKLDAVSTTMSNDIKEKRQTTKEERKVKAIFKRNADDSNLIFWNDIYDDEYGIQADKFDNTVRDKHSVNENDFIKKSGRWVHDKIRKFAENLKMNPHTQDMEIKERLPRSVSSPGLITYPKYLYERISDRLTRRSTDDREDDDIENEQKLIFTSLTANMKDVCKKAARAVQLSRNIEVREDSKQGSIATSLMQQLVRLLTDLVDYQVQQKTCTKLPSDLQNFLEWLTVPKEEAQEAQTDALTYKTPYQEDDLIDELEIPSDERPNDQPPDYETIGFNEKLGSGDLRIHYLDVLHSVQDLLDHYEEMSDEEKSKMTGVKSYLESQMRYLNKQLSGYDLYSLFEKHQHQMRYKRDLTIKPRLTKRRRKRKPQKYVKNFGKKHTRTTASFDDAVPITDNKRKVIKEDKSINKLINRAFEEKVSKDVRRNLKDVYYKAVAEAKKYATAKNVHKKDDNTAFESTSVSAHT
ncbi:uncharacterized protein LOC113500123 isoform X4 [Trichoplusia ni]|uniref:Uncharacterized protein LOC113500123 isoform X4 n=1 Tax=Trichoplusia ni TaxID=7111 RepID=A0A7E5W7X4_TRINI|nr:uncharacterized protein LOC113500123 isoform X4 [Trichoplusia ni]